jgi:hypothetical protein
MHLAQAPAPCSQYRQQGGQLKLPKKTLIRVLASAHAAHDLGIAGTVVGTAETVTYAFRADTDE